MKSVVIALGQGVRSVRPTAHGNSSAIHALRKNALSVSRIIPAPPGFSDRIPDLGSGGLFPSAYAAGSIFQRTLFGPEILDGFVPAIKDLSISYFCTLDQVTKIIQSEYVRASKFPIFESTILTKHATASSPQ